MKQALAFALLAACSSRVQSPEARFANAPPVWVVDDRRDVPEMPKPRQPQVHLTQLDGLFLNPISQALAIPSRYRAIGVNALDEVPNSTWFTNRDIRALTPEEIRRGPEEIGSPEAHKPWTIKSTKVGGTAVGFIIKDARGEEYILKFDPSGYPELETAAAAITNRLVWAFGYNVPEDDVVYLRREDLVLSKDATIKDDRGKRPLTQAELDRRLSMIVTDPDGRIRGIVSRMLDGKWLGGHPARGVRSDDPNDRIPHERRRDLRGQYPLFAWLDHVDTKEANTLDMWVKDPEDPKRHYVKHYFLDFGKSLGAMSAIHNNPRSGYEYAYDFREMARGAAGIGIRERAWERRAVPALRGVGPYEATTFDPGGWKPNTPSYLPFRVADRIDKFWGAKRLIQFSRAQIAAAVDAGKLSDPRSAKYLVDTIVARQRQTARYWFERVNPLDQFEAVDEGLCFVDLALEYRLAPREPTRYAVTSLDRNGRVQSKTAVIRPNAARSCTPGFDGAGDYHILRVETRRPTGTLTTYVHLARDPRTGARRVIGIWRS